MRNEQIKIQVEGSGKDVCLETYILGDVMDGARNRKTPLVLICPGGGYAMTSNREAEPIALQFNSMGYQAAVLRYSCAPAVYPTALCEVAQSVKLIREHAEDWNVDAEKIIVMGFSAGGHLAASYGVFWNESWLTEKMQCDKQLLKPNGLVLCYPVISSKEEIAHQDSIKNLLGESYPEMKEQVSLEDKVGKHTPKTFLCILLQILSFLFGILSDLQKHWEKQGFQWNIIYIRKEGMDFLLPMNRQQMKKEKVWKKYVRAGFPFFVHGCWKISDFIRKKALQL